MERTEGPGQKQERLKKKKSELSILHSSRGLSIALIIKEKFYFPCSWSLLYLLLGETIKLAVHLISFTELHKITFGWHCQLSFKKKIGVGPYKANNSRQEIWNETISFPINFTELAQSLNKKMPPKNVKTTKCYKNARNYY